MEKKSINLLFNELISCYLKFHPGTDIQVLHRAYNLAFICHKGQFRKDKNPYFFHPLSVGILLAKWGLDNSTIAASLLHDTVEDVPADKRDGLRKSIKQDFGEEIYNIVEGVTKKEKLPDISKNERKEVSLKKMFLHSSRDIRVLLVKIADRLHNMRTLDSMKPRKQLEISKETLSVYVPLAKVLGLYFVARDLEDLSLYYLNRDVYTRLNAIIDNCVSDIEKQFEDFKSTLSKALKKSNIKILKLEKRNRNLFSVLKKYLRKSKAESIDFDSIELDELILNEIVKELNVVITVSSKIEIGKVIGIINSHFQNMPNTLFSSWEEEIYDHFLQVGDTYGTVNIGFRCEEENMMRLRETAERAKASFNLEKARDGIFGSFLSFSKLLKEVHSLRPTNVFYKIFENIVSSPQILVFTSDNNSILIPMDSTVLDLIVLLNDLTINDSIPNIRVFVNGIEADLSRKLNNNDKVEIISAWGDIIIKPQWIDMVELEITKEIIQKQYEKQYDMDIAISGKEKLMTSLRIKRLDQEILDNAKFWKLIEEKMGITESDSTYIKLYNDPLLLEEISSIALRHKEIFPGTSVSISKRIKNLFKGFNKPALCLDDIESKQLYFCKICKPLTGEPITGAWESNLLHIHRIDEIGISHIIEPKNCFPLKWGKRTIQFDIPVNLIVKNAIGNLEKLLVYFENENKIDLLDIIHNDKGEISQIHLTLRLNKFSNLSVISKLLDKIDFVLTYKIRDI